MKNEGVLFVMVMQIHQAVEFRCDENKMTYICTCVYSK